MTHGIRVNPGTLTWSKTADMRRGRWYPSSTELANGSIVTLAGKDENAIWATVPEIWSGGSWRALTGASLILPYYPRQFLAPHAFDMGQRFMWLTFSRTSSGLTVQAPASRNIAPPGYYMLFILTSNGVPSRARIIRLR